MEVNKKAIQTTNSFIKVTRNLRMWELDRIAITNVKNIIKALKASKKYDINYWKEVLELMEDRKFPKIKENLKTHPLNCLDVDSFK